jgi:hypothetical protein
MASTGWGSTYTLVCVQVHVCAYTFKCICFSVYVYTAASMHILMCIYTWQCICLDVHLSFIHLAMHTPGGA